jgi:hypothetical protein
MGWKDDARRRAKDKQEGDRYKLQTGDNKFRILPNKEDPKSRPYTEFLMHYGVGPDKMGIRCGKDIENQGSCWLCDGKISELGRSSDHSRQDMARALQAKEAFVLQVSPVNTETRKFEKPRGWWISSRKLTISMLQILSDAEYDFEDPVEGFNIKVNRVGEGLKTSYGTPIPDRKPSRVPTAILEASKPLEELTPPYSAKRQKAAFYGRDPSEYEEDEPEVSAEPEAEVDEEEEYEDAADEDVADEDAADEDDDEVDEEEDYEDETAVDEEDEEEDYEDEEEEEEPEPPPPPRRRPAKKAPAKKAPTKKATKKAPAKKAPTKKATKRRRR